MPWLVLDDDLVADRLEPGLREQRPVLVAAERSEEHRRAEPVGLDLLPAVAGSERPEQETPGSKPGADVADQRALLGGGNVAEEVERHHRVERGTRDLELGRVRLDEARLRNVVSRELDLHGGDVHPGDPMSARQLTRRGNSAPAPELEDVGAVLQPCVEVTHPFQRRRIDPARATISFGSRATARPASSPTRGG